MTLLPAPTPSHRRHADRPRFRLNVDQYHRMIEQGILEEGAPLELLDGRLLLKNRSAVGEDPVTLGNDHMWVVDTLVALNPKLAKLGCYLRGQQAVSLPPFSEPEPDGVIVLGDKDRYRRRRPTTDDVLCVIEVADSSLARDRTTKLRIYANAGVPVYILINLPDRVIEVYSSPIKGRGRYARTETLLRSADRVTFPTARGKGLTIPVKTLLP